MITKQANRECANLFDSFITEHLLITEKEWENCERIRVKTNYADNSFKVVEVNNGGSEENVLFAFKLVTDYDVITKKVVYSLKILKDAPKDYTRTQRLIRKFGKHSVVWYWINNLRWVI